MVPVGHTVPQTPQFAPSLWRSQQPSGQLVGASGGQTHAPARHLAPGGQCTPIAAAHAVSPAGQRVHPPQLAGSPVTSTHWSRGAVPSPVSQYEVPARQRHALETHSCPPVHRVPVPAGGWHPPQAIGSRTGSRHSRPHCTSPLAQVASHVPREHTCPGAQATAHAPQCAGSARVSRHTPSQSCQPAPQSARHSPRAQTRPGSHAVEQVPQCRSSLCRSTQLEPHTVIPVGQ